VAAAAGGAFSEENEGSPAWGLLLLGGALLAVAALDVGLLLLGWGLALVGAAGAGSRGRLRGAPVVVAGGSLGLLAAGLFLAVGRSLPAVGVDGAFGAHTTDLIQLSYLNYFGDQRLLGLRLDAAGWGLLVAGGGLPPLALLLSAEAGRGRRLVLSVPLWVLAFYAGLRLGGGLFPQAAVAGMRWLAGAGLFGLLLLTLRALQERTLQAMLAPLLVAQLLATTLGLAAGTQAGLLAALLGLWRYGLGALLLWTAGPGGAGTGTARGERVLQLGTTLLVLGAPGLLGFPAALLLLYGAAPTQRLAAVVLLGVLLGTTARAVPRIFYEQPGSGLREPAGAPGAPLGVRLALLLVAILLGVAPQLLIARSAGWVNDFLSHTVGHLGAAALAGLF
jgi:NADH-quinone oxidoreductase subunit M